MSYILIQNDGEVESGAFELIGASTKRDSPEKIGFFGSGLKYSIAFMLRNNIDFKIYSGEKEIKFSVQTQEFREKSFERICINGQPTSYTTTMGPTWNEDWFVLREIYCNALDETNCQLIKSTDNINSVAGKTRIYIELNEALKKIVDNWDRYFSNDRDPIFVNTAYTSFLQQGSTKSAQGVKIFPKTDGVVFRKGIRSHEDKRLLFDYEIDFADINEDRRLKNPTALQYMYCDLVASFTDEHYVLCILREGQDDEAATEYKSLHSTQKNASPKWVDFSKRFTLVVKEISGRYSDKINKSEKEVLYIPSAFARMLKQSDANITIIGMGNVINNVSFSECEQTPKMSFLLKEVTEALRQMKYTFPYPVTVVSFAEHQVLGQADVKAKQIYLSDTIFDMGRREIALTIIEECEHIASKVADESRAFQNHLISSWLKSMEESNALFL